MKRVLGAAFLMLSMTACGAAPNDSDTAIDIGENHEAIINGQDISSDPAVMLLLGISNNPRQPFVRLCTATLVTPTVLLTAAHCVEPVKPTTKLPNPPQLVYRVFPGAHLARGRVSARLLLTVNEVIADPAFNESHLIGGHDAGIAILARPATVPPMAVNLAPMTPEMRAAEVRIIGYGRTSVSAPPTSFQRREMISRVARTTNELLSIAAAPANVCMGDSGGPVIEDLDGVDTVVGITSFTTSRCQHGEVATRVDGDVEFLAPFIQP
jgi:hypothetical protein